MPQIRPRRLSIWFDYASPYAYLAVSRVGALARERVPDCEIDWRPFLLGPIFQRRSSNSAGPFMDMSPAERHYRWRDLQRHAALYGIPWQLPKRYPPAGLNAARLTLVAQDRGWGEALIHALYRAAFVEDRDIGDDLVLAGIVADLGHDAADLLTAMKSSAIKARLTRQVETAIEGGLFGAPSFVVGSNESGTGGEVFWGNDRLEQALAWAAAPWLEHEKPQEAEQGA